MPLHMVGAGHWTAGTHLSSLGFFWFGLVNLVLLFGFLGATGRRSGAAGSPARGEKAPPAAGAGPPSVPRLAFRPSEVGLTLVRVSDAERDQAVETVRLAVGEGRLDVDEAVERIGACIAARHRAELSGLLADLPPMAPPSRGRAPSARARRARGALRAASVLAVLAALVLQAAAGLWELWPVAVVTLAPLAWTWRVG